jgi:hypothetical protein
MTIRQADSEDQINEIANDLEDLKTTVEELQNDPPSDIDPNSLDGLKNALDDAVDATDELEEQQEQADEPQPKE